MTPANDKQSYNQRRTKLAREQKQLTTSIRRRWLKPGMKKVIIDFDTTMRTMVQAAFQRGVRSGYIRGFKRAQTIGRLDVRVL